MSAPYAELLVDTARDPHPFATQGGGGLFEDGADIFNRLAEFDPLSGLPRDLRGEPLLRAALKPGLEVVPKA